MPAKRQPVAHRYVRFSSKPQERGDSVRRQTDLFAAWCETNKVPPAPRTYANFGRSALTGAHLTDSDVDGLAAFLAEIDKPNGCVKSGDYLTIENLDRLSRLEVRKALGLFTRILDAGVHIATTAPAYLFRHDSSNIADMVIAIVELSRSHGESARKSDSLKESWQDRRKQWQEKGGTLTRRVPAWITVTPDGERVENRKVSAVIKELFRLAAEGHGVYTIAGLMNQRGSTTPSGKPWSESTVYYYLTCRQVLGEFTTRLGRKRKGVVERPTTGIDTIPDYYPQIITPDVFNHVQRVVGERYKLVKDGKRRPSQGGRGKLTATNLFPGRVFVAGTDKTYVVRGGGNGCKRLDPLGLRTAVSISYARFEAAILSHIRELTPADVLPDQGQTVHAEVEAVRVRLDELKSKVAEFSEAAKLRPGSAVASVLVALEIQQDELEAEYRAALARLDAFRPELLESTQELLQVADDPANRVKLRTELGRLIRRIDVVAQRGPHHGSATFTARMELATGVVRYVAAGYSGRGPLIHIDLEIDDAGNVLVEGKPMGPVVETFLAD